MRILEARLPSKSLSWVRIEIEPGKRVIKSNFFKDWLIKHDLPLVYTLGHYAEYLHSKGFETRERDI